MNAQYYDFDPNDPKSSYGLYIRQADKAPIDGEASNQDVGIFCGLPCHEGQAECRASGSLFNSKQMIKVGQGNATTVAWDFGKGVGWWVNRTDAIKCSYAWDGATPTKYNRGCGCEAGTTDCQNPNNAWKNTDPKTGKAYAGDSANVNTCACETKDPKHEKPTKWEESVKCFWKGPAYDLQAETADDTWQMMKWRVQKQDYTPWTPLPLNIQSPVAYWNEAIVDSELLLKMLKEDAAGTIPAIVYTRGSKVLRESAQHIAKVMQEAYHLPKPVPVIALDTEVDLKSGGDVFVAEADWTFEQVSV